MVYCLVPLTLFLCAWRLTRAPGYSFAAAMLYSLTSPTQLLAPDVTFRWNAVFDARRLFLATYWDETPHLLGLALLPLTILFLARVIETGRRRYYAAAALSIAAATLASAFGPIDALIAALCLIAALSHKGYGRNLAHTAAIGILAYALSAVFLPPSLVSAIRGSSDSPMHPEALWTAGSFTAIAIVVLGWTVLWQFLPRWTSDWRLRFFALFAYLTMGIPMVFVYFQRQFLPQPGRYKLEAELGLALLIVFGLRAWLERTPVAIRRAAVLLLVALALEQINHYRVDMRNYLPRAGAYTIEARASVWADRNLPGVRVWLPGSIAQWANLFSDVPQFSGSSFSMAYNPVQQRGIQAVYQGDARVSLAWLEAFGAGAVAVPGDNSEEFWKGFTNPSRFEGLLPVLWREGGVTIYRVPQRAASLAHVVLEAALVQHAPRGIGDIAELERYDAALEDPSLPAAEMQWEGRNRIRIHTTQIPGQVVSIQVSYHPGWHPAVNGRALRLHRDGLGLMWLQPDCNGPCDVDLTYDGGWELRLCRWISVVAFAILFIMFCAPSRPQKGSL